MPISLAEFFGKISLRGALMTKATTSIEIEKCNKALTDCGIPPLPEEYALILKTTNGFAWNGFDFYGTCEAKAQSGYTLWDIVAINKKHDVGKDILILGIYSEDYYVYDVAKKRYRVLDRHTRMELDAFDSLHDMLLQTIGLYAFPD